MRLAYLGQLISFRFMKCFFDEEYPVDNLSIPVVPLAEEGAFDIAETFEEKTLGVSIFGVVVLPIVWSASRRPSCKIDRKKHV